MSTFIVLLLAHLLADFPLQTNRIFRLKITSNVGLALHVLIHVLMAALLLQQPGQYLDLLLALATAHFVTDWLKVRFPTEPQWPGFVLDQVAHLAAIAGLAWWRPTATARHADAALGVGQRCPAPESLSPLTLRKLGQPPTVNHLPAHRLDCRTDCGNLSHHSAVALGLSGYIFLLQSTPAAWFNCFQANHRGHFGKRTAISPWLHRISNAQFTFGEALK